VSLAGTTQSASDRTRRRIQIGRRFTRITLILSRFELRSAGEVGATLVVALPGRQRVSPIQHHERRQRKLSQAGWYHGVPFVPDWMRGICIYRLSVFIQLSIFVVVAGKTMSTPSRPPRNEGPRLKLILQDRSGRLFVAIVLWVVCFGLGTDVLDEIYHQLVLSGLALFMSALAGLYVGLDFLIVARPSRWVWPRSPLLTRLGGLLFISFNLMVGWSAIQRLLTSFQ
jgi:hypothetical protein